MRRAMARTAAWGPEIPRPEALASHTKFIEAYAPRGSVHFPRNRRHCRWRLQLARDSQRLADRALFRLGRTEHKEATSSRAGGDPVLAGTVAWLLDSRLHGNDADAKLHTSLLQARSASAKNA